MKLHYSQTMPVIDKKVYTFQYLMKLHYSQTLYRLIMNYNRVSVPYEITLLSNQVVPFYTMTKFQYLMKLHYSQTSKAT